MDIAAIEQKLVSGEELKIKYKYPIETRGSSNGPQVGVRTDKLSDVSIELKRFYTKFRGDAPIWVDEHEVVDITPDDGVYEEYPAE